MKTYKIKTSYFNNHINPDKIGVLDIDLQDNIKNKIDLNDCVKIFYHNKNPFLYINKSGDYVIVSNPCYVNSVIEILESINIKNYIIKNNNTTDRELTASELLELLKVNVKSESESD